MGWLVSARVGNVRNGDSSVIESVARGVITSAQMRSAIMSMERSPSQSYFMFRRRPSSPQFGRPVLETPASPAGVFFFR